MISHEGTEGILKIRSLDDSCLLLKVVSEVVQNGAKEQKGRFLSVLLGTLGAILLENMLAGKRINRSGDGIIRACYGSNGSSKNKSFNSALSFF